MRKILIVEDDADTLDLVEIILLDAGYCAIKVNREVTIKEIAAIKPHLVIVDYLLPFVLGTDLCLQIKANDLTKHIPVILYSASSNLQTLAKESCADGYMTKPFDIDDLVNMVNRLAL